MSDLNKILTINKFNQENTSFLSYISNNNPILHTTNLCLSLFVCLFVCMSVSPGGGRSRDAKSGGGCPEGY